MENLIPIINKLQDVFNAIGSDGIQLPQIVVVGTQSSGKSSVLENIVGRSFLPRGTGIVTRTPLVLQLVHSPNVPGPHRRKDDGTLDVDEYGVFLHSKTIFTDFEEIRKEIESQTDRITGTNKGISAEVISLKVYSPSVVNLTLVDLPGLTKVPVGDQPKDIETQIQNLVLKYIQNPNSIIMAVVTANTDMATNESLKLAKDCDPKGDRTLAVVTKLDLMDAGTDATDILRGRVIPVKLGIIAVINRSQKDIRKKKPISEAQKDEAEFLRKKYPSLADCNGTPYLAKTLNKLLMKHIKDCLPDLKKRVQLMTIKEQALLKSYGENVTDKNEMLLRIITQFSSAYIASITGAAANLKSKTLVGGARICYIFHEKFKSEINEIDPLLGTTRESVLMLMRNATGPRPALFIPELAFEVLVKEQIQRLQDPSLRCADLVHEEMQLMLDRCCSDMEPLLRRFPAVRDKIQDLVSTLLNKRMCFTNSMIQNIIEIESSYINTRHPHFDRQRALLRKEEFYKERREETLNPSLEEVQKLFANAGIQECKIPLMSDSESGEETPNPSFEEDQKLFVNAGINKSNSKENEELLMSQSENKDCVIIENMLKSYFEIVRTTINDVVPKTVMHYLVNYIKENVQTNLTTQLYKSKATDELFQEAQHIAQERKVKSNILKALSQAGAIINEIRDFYV